MNIEAIKNVIKEQYNKNKYALIDDYIQHDCKSDGAAVAYGPLTIEIASSIGVTQSKARYYLNKYHKSGGLVKLEANGGSCRWWYHGMLSELRSDCG